MRRLVFEPKSGSWKLESLGNNGTVIMDCSELTPEGIAMRFDRQEILSSLQQAAETLKALS